MAKGIHLFPFRTEKLSPLAPMVLPTGGRVGRCRIQMERVTEMWLSLFLSYLSCLVVSSLLFSSCVLCTCSVFFFVMCCFGFSLSLSLLFSFSAFFFRLLSVAFFALCSLCCSVSSLLRFFVALFFFCPFFFLFLFSLVVVLCCLLALPVSACLIFSLCLLFFFCACACFCWIRFVYLLLNLFCFDIKL